MSESTRWVRIAHCRDIPPREGRAVKVGGREIAVFNLGDRFLAIENRCPHKGGPLADGIVSGAAVVCPLHAWKMSLETGRGVNGPSALSCVDTFRIRVEGRIVLLELTDNCGQSEATATGSLPAMCTQRGEIASAAGHPLAEA
jgi:nitrite reductase (NADH) small subunit